MQPDGSQPYYVQSLSSFFGAARYYLYLVGGDGLCIELECCILQYKRPHLVTRPVDIQMSLTSAHITVQHALKVRRLLTLFASSSVIALSNCCFSGVTLGDI